MKNIYKGIRKRGDGQHNEKLLLVFAFKQIHIPAWLNKIIFLDCLNPWALINPSMMNRFYEMWNYGNTLARDLQTHFSKHQNK